MLLNSTNSKKIHCPFEGCLYNGPGKWFSGKKFLNQHVAKVHAEKKYFCEKCGKGFGLDWWRKHHEKTCGIEWFCVCGSKYTSRESLLTHARRNYHELPEHVLHTERMKQRKTFFETKENPVIVVIQPIIQTINCNQKVFHHAVLNPRPILPKATQPHFVDHSKVADAINNPAISTSLLSNNQNSLVPNLMHFNSNSNINQTQRAVATQTYCESTSSPSSCLKENSLKQTYMSIAIQTSNESEHCPKSRESRASQCSRRKSKASGVVDNESTHTQTAESAVVKIKRKRSRRKSVAITTESNMLTPQRQDLEHSIWPDFKDLIFHNSEMQLPITQSFRNTMSTQTNCYNNKVLCDSQTITDEELFKFNWTETTKKDYKSSICKSPFRMPVDIPPEDPLTTALQNSMVCNTLPEFDLFSSNSVLKGDKHTKVGSNFAGTSTENSLGNEACPIFDMFTACPKSDDRDKISHPMLSDIHTQTMTNSELDFNLLANMETQTTDEFALYDLLEFSDTETQTPWDDFPDIDESPLPPDQLSIEIQTDFSSLNAELNPDPYAFFNGTYVQNMIDDCSDKERLSVNIETQTQDKFTFPQLTNSESQTLDISHLML